MAPEYAELVELLIDGARYGDAEDVHAALEHQVDVNAQDEQGRTGGTPGDPGGCLGKAGGRGRPWECRLA